MREMRLRNALAVGMRLHVSWENPKKASNHGSVITVNS